MTIGEFMFGAFAIAFAGGIGAYLTHLFVKGLGIVTNQIGEFIAAWRDEDYQPRPYDHKRQGI